MTPEISSIVISTFDFERIAALLALAFFFGFAFEEYFSHSRIKPPGGVRTFPLLALIGALLYALDPERKFLLITGLIILGLWLAIYYRQRLTNSTLVNDDDEQESTQLDGGIVAPVCNLIAFLLGPVTLTTPLWVPVSVAVFAVLLISARERLHRFAATLREGEIVTLAKFLIIIGIVLPLVPDTPITTLTDITPYQVWLAVVAVSTLSYASYLVQRFIAPDHGVYISAALGGLYSSTATTVILSRRAADATQDTGTLQSAIVLTTAIMFLRILTVVGVFNIELAKLLLLPLGLLCAFGLTTSFLIHQMSGACHGSGSVASPPANPLEVTTAITFAGLFIILSIGVAWAKAHFGEEGLFLLGALAGVTDVDPFVLNLAQGAGALNLHAAATAILVAASSNNILKAVYTVTISGRQRGLKPALILFALAAAGLIAAFVILHRP
ncbi:MAG: MgtC/SapB family protein [Parvibaculaceae bacterium]